MPYFNCPHCEVRVYSASIRWHRDECPVCGEAIPPPEARAKLLAEPIEQVSEELSREASARTDGSG
jgi:DNA repair exonuclease SbcCD ATPase subunit